MSSWRSGSAAGRGVDEKGAAAVRILVLTPTFLPAVGGAELVLLEVYRRLAVRHEVRLLTPSLPAGLLQEQGSGEYDTLVTFPVERYHDRISFMNVPGHRWTAGAVPPFSLSAVTAVRRVAKTFRPQVLNVHYVMPTGLAGLVAEQWLGIPTVATLSGRDVPGPGVPPLWRWWQRVLLAGLSDATYISEYCREALYGKGPAKGRVIYAGVDSPPPPGDGALVRRQLGIAPHEPVIFALQRLALDKRVEVLLRAFHACRRETGAGVLIIGGKGPREPALRALTAELGLEKDVRFVGYIPRADLGSYFLACDLFAFHSTFETFGIVVAQAMSYGKAVVTVRNTSLPEVTGDGGIVVDTGDWRAFGQAMARLIRDEPERARLGAAGRRRAERLFNWDRIAEHYEAALIRAAGHQADAT
jgi:glycosyltransferase involved in cell wall biosynthesis